MYTLRGQPPDPADIITFVRQADVRPGIRGITPIAEGDEVSDPACFCFSVLSEEELTIQHFESIVIKDGR